MATPAHGFKRLVLALQPGAGPADLRFPAEMARQLDLELLALVLDDLGLAEAARLPFTREFRGPASGWQPLDPGQLASDIQASIENFRRSIESTARKLEGNAQFEVLKGPLAETIRAVSRAGDILLLAEPASPAERASVQFNWLTEAVLASSAAVLLVPARLARQKGPVVAIATAEDDRSSQVAAEISASCGEKLVIIDADHHDQLLAARGGDEDLRVERISVSRGILADALLLHYAFENLKERLIVINRATFDEGVASTVASSRRVPVLLIKPS